MNYPFSDNILSSQLLDYPNTQNDVNEIERHIASSPTTIDQEVLTRQPCLVSISRNESKTQEINNQIILQNPDIPKYQRLLLPYEMDDNTNASIPLDPTSNPPLSAEQIELRRKRNRESMRRARARQKNLMQAMKNEVQKLEKILNIIHLADDAKQLLHNSELISLGGHQWSNYSVPVRLAAMKMFNQYLEAEHQYLGQMVFQKSLITRMVGTYLQMEETDEKRSKRIQLDMLHAKYFYTPITEDHACDLIFETYCLVQEIGFDPVPIKSSVIESREKQPKESKDMEDSMHKNEAFYNFGWEVIYKEYSGIWVVIVSKDFPTLDPTLLMQRSWDNFSMSSHNHTRHAPLQSFEMLQEINADTHVLARTNSYVMTSGEYQGKKVSVRNVYVRFRLETEGGGYVIGRRSINPKNPVIRSTHQRAGNFQYIDSSSYMEFKEKENGTRVSYAVHVPNTHAYTMRESILLAMSLVLTWEKSVIGELANVLKLNS